MLNFHTLKLVVEPNYSFVGIDKHNSQLRFCLPKGFDPDEFATYDSRRNLFFMLYKILCHFKSICLHKGYLKTTDDRDGVIQGSGSVQKIYLPNTDNEESNIFYSKLDHIGTMLDAYDELKIISLAYRLGIHEEIDYSKIHRFLHQSIYLDNGAAYIDSMNLPRRQVQYQSTDIVGMYCYIICEIKYQLDEEVRDEIKIIAENFSQRYIGSEYSLFHENYYTQTINILKNTLELIEVHTPFKDNDYWQFYNAIELFLYGELSPNDEGEIWGIRDFYSVWESMCLTFIVKNLQPKFILYVDSSYISDDLATLANIQPKILDLNNAFTIKNNINLKPDIVFYSNHFDYLYMEILNNPSLLIRDILVSVDNWDDNFMYTTSFNSDLDYFDNIHLRICYEGQPPNEKHTFAELEKNYKIYNYSNLLINSQLPSKFYSFWRIDFDSLNSVVIALMYQLNHIFYVAVKNGVFTVEDFQMFLVNKFRISQDNVFTRSLFRDVRLTSSYGINDRIIRNNEDDILVMFSKFINAISQFKIIDIKYLDSNFFLNDDNCRTIKERSIRKQFTYEYLLEKYICHNINFKSLEINSTFWLPSYKNTNFDLISEKPVFLKNYIFLEKINFAIIAEQYSN